MQHTQEPWQIGNAHDCARDHAVCGGASVIARVIGCGYPLGIGWSPKSQADTDRIVACVNACAGIEDPAAELARLRRVEEWARSAAVIIPEYMAYSEEMRTLGRGLMDPCDKNGCRPDHILRALRSALEG